MAVKLSDLTTEASPASTDILAIADPTTGVMRKITVADLKTYMDTIGGAVAPTVVSATCPSDDTDTVVVVFSQSMTAVTTAGWSFENNASAWGITSVSGSGTTWTFQMVSAAFIGNTLTRSYDSTTGATIGTSLELVSFTDVGVTNNAGDVTAPTVVSATVQNTDPDTIVVVFSESVTGVSAPGWSFKKNGSAWSISTVTGSGTTWNFNMATAAVFGDTLLRSYDSTTGATVDGASNELVTFTDSAVTNSVSGGATYLTWASVPSTYEVYNSSKGIRTTAGHTPGWGGGVRANQTLSVGERMVVKTDGIDNFASFGISNNTDVATGNDYVVGARQTDEELIDALVFASFSEAINNNYFYCIYYEAEESGGGGNGIARLQKSADGISWTTLASITTLPYSGALNMKVYIYSASFGWGEAYKI
jgi:hypothetical protein